MPNKFWTKIKKKKMVTEILEKEKIVTEQAQK